jgi:serine/threonine-protein kinase
MVTRIGRFRASVPLGAGALGPLYKAYDEHVGRTVALRILDSAIACDASRLGEVLDAAALAATLSNPFIATLFDIVADASTPALAFEYVDGVPLRTTVGGRPMPVRYALDIAGALAEALAHAHERGIAHLDVRPANLLVSGRGRPKLIETGFAAFTGGGRARRLLKTDPDDAPDTARGIAPYVSPEEAIGDAGTEASDVFSLGVIAYELLTGQRPFEAPRAADALVRVVKDDPPRPGQLNATVSPALDALVLGCLDKHPQTRLRARVVATRIGSLLAEMDDAERPRA